MAEYDSSTAFIHMRDASKLFSTKDNVTGVRLKLDDLFDAPEVSSDLQKALGDTYAVSDWGQENKSLFQVQKTEKVVMFFILFLIVLVALFNLVSSLVMVVNDKQADIAILRTQGMSAKQVKRIFMVQGVIIRSVWCHSGGDIRRITGFEYRDYSGMDRNTDRHLGMLSHVTVSDSDWVLPQWEKRRRQILDNPQVTGAAPFIEKQVMLKEADTVQATLLEGVLPNFEKDIGTINRYIQTPEGSSENVSLNVLKAGGYKIVLGETLAKTLGVTVGETITLVEPKKTEYYECG
ncbi:Lipoprotein-releasing system transmembrane protein LolC [Nymphon striatum]|nr:Lipoprotein-releasing system transmembrane protein LolC [Nymphon striatum]